VNYLASIAYKIFTNVLFSLYTRPVAGKAGAFVLMDIAQPGPKAKNVEPESRLIPAKITRVFGKYNIGVFGISKKRKKFFICERDSAKGTCKRSEIGVEPRTS
jgi:hypothetical protein